MAREITKWSRLPSITSLQNEMNRMFDRFFGGWDSTEPLMETSMLAPAVDLSETTDKIIIKAEVPGVNPNEINIAIQHNTLLIKGEKKEEKEEKGKSFYRMERRYGNFARTIELPTSVDPDKITAEYKNGVLEITMEKKEAAKPKQISVKVG
ncbi:MAG: 17.4 kDa class I heat shock protein 4 [Candidatus Jettenia ecosi]|uniref:17.4 kDa class I heat shock protein 4 n=1 Tax=Candidatus Jettenia ecosi TaxID=2494326 RepID=A0A533QBF9_9BACT|nr:MAG: 17.4 kDa class I heat shock protein 4 [Candidatus Jettenia ecosi]